MIRATTDLENEIRHITSADTIDGLLRGALYATHALSASSVAWVVLLSGRIRYCCSTAQPARNSQCAGP